MRVLKNRAVSPQRGGTNAKMNSKFNAVSVMFESRCEHFSVTAFLRLISTTF